MTVLKGGDGARVRSQKSNSIKTYCKIGEFFLLRKVIISYHINDQITKPLN